MSPFKKDLTPLRKGGQVTKHEGKGSRATALPDRQALTALASAPNAGLNDYAKATPMAQPAPMPTVGLGKLPGRF